MSMFDLHSTAQDFLDVLDLPSENPFVDEEQEHEFAYNHDRASSFLHRFVPAGLTILDDQFSSHTQRTQTPLAMLSSTPTTVCTNVSSLAGESDYSNGPICPANQSATVAPGGVSMIHAVRSFASLLFVVVRQIGPGIIAASHLFFRLFAPAILSFMVLFLLMEPILFKDQVDVTNKRRCYFHYVAAFLALLCTVVIATDAMYIFEFGMMPLVVLHGVTAILVLQRSRRRSLEATRLVLPLTAVAILLMMCCDLDLPSDIAPGFYYDKKNPLAAAIAEEWPSHFRAYSPSPWVVNGDTRTGIPFFLNRIPDQHYVRRWVSSKVPNESEAVIMDIAFPLDGVHRRDKPIYFILCGLSGGSQEGYVKDLVSRRRAEGSTVVVMVARGLMESFIAGEELLNFARVSDIDAAVRALRRAVAPSQTVAGVGYSMGAITLANYVARSGTDCQLDVAVAISGALDTRRQIEFHRSEVFWQPLLIKALRDIIVAKFREQLLKRLTPEQIYEVVTSTTVVEFDRKFFARYHGFKSVEHYYSELGAMGDLITFDGAPKELGRISNVSIPLLVVNALDDPIAYPRCLGDPALVSMSGAGNTMLLVTRKGGHVGWPVGWNPASQGWIWMSTVASSFVESTNLVFQRSSCSE